MSKPKPVNNFDPHKLITDKQFDSNLKNLAVFFSNIRLRKKVNIKKTDRGKYNESIKDSEKFEGLKKKLEGSHERSARFHDNNN